MSIAPGRPVPDLDIRATDGSRFELSKQHPAAFTLVVFYRGFHCRVCKTYLKELHQLRGAFAAEGIEVIAVSMDDAETAQRTVREWELEGLLVGHGLQEQDALDWGLYISEGAKEGEPARFSEPGLFLIAPGGTLYYLAINSAAYGRPPLGPLLDAVRSAARNAAPPQGLAASP